MRIRPKSWTRLINLAEPGFVYGWALYGSLTLQSELGFPHLSRPRGVGRKALIERQVRPYCRTTHTRPTKEIATGKSETVLNKRADICIGSAKRTDHGLW